MLWSKTNRIEALFNHEIPDQVPIFECLLHDGALEHFGGKKIEPNDAEGFIKGAAKCLDVSHPAWLPEVSRVEEDSACLNRLKKSGTVIYGKWGFYPGFVRKYEKWTNWVTEFPFNNEDKCAEWINEQIEIEESLLNDDSFVKNYCRRIELIKEWKGNMVYPEIYTMDGFYKNYITIGIEKFSYLYCVYPELIQKWVKVTNERILRKIEVKLHYNVSPVAMMWSDLAAKGGLIFPPEMLEDLCYPYIEEIVNLLHSKNIKVIFHSDGDLTKALYILVDRCKIDGLNTIDVGAGMNVRQLKQEYGNRLVLVGGMDANILTYGNKEQVIAGTKELIDIAGKRGGLCIASSFGEIGNDMPLENILAYFDTVWRYGKY